MTQPRLFDGYEVQAEYLKVPGVDKKLALRSYIPQGTEPTTGDGIWVTVFYRLTRQPKAPIDNQGELGDVEETWQAVPVTNSLKVTRYLSAEEVDSGWQEQETG